MPVSLRWYVPLPGALVADAVESRRQLLQTPVCEVVRDAVAEAEPGGGKKPPPALPSSGSSVEPRVLIRPSEGRCWRLRSGTRAGEAGIFSLDDDAATESLPDVVGRASLEDTDKKPGGAVAVMLSAEVSLAAWMPSSSTLCSSLVGSVPDIRCCCWDIGMLVTCRHLKLRSSSGRTKGIDSLLPSSSNMVSVFEEKRMSAL